MLFLSFTPLVLFNYAIEQVKIDTSGYIRTFYGGWQLWTETYKDSLGLRQGKSSMWYENGNLKWQCTYGNDSILGEVFEWHENGKIKSKSRYMNDMLNGPFQVWYSNGKNEIKGEYKDDKPIGIWIEYSPDGKRCRKGIYTSGSFEKIESDGTKIIYEGVVKEGEWKYYSKNKRKEIGIEIYIEGKVVNQYGYTGW